jgi:MFS family permease
MWRLGFFFHEMSYGLLLVFIPLHIVGPVIGGSLIDIGIMTSLALFSAIPAAFFWGYICDKTRHFKVYILISFISVSIILYFLAFATSILVFIALYVIMSIFHAGHEAPKNVLIAEHYSHQDWGRSFSLYGGITTVGWLIGLFLGFLISILALGAIFTFVLCSALNLIAFVLSIFLVADPLIIFERRLVNIEKKIDYTYRGLIKVTRLLDGLPIRAKLESENFLAFGIGVILFSLASSLFLTPLPIFFARDLAFPASMVFMIYVLNYGGAVGGYFLSGNMAMSPSAKKHMRRMVLVRGVLVFLLLAIVVLAVYPSFLAAVILIPLGFARAFYHILALSLSMEIMPAGRAGMFDVLVGLGAASGSFLGPFVAQIMGFLPQFLIAGIIFFSAYVAFKFFS